MNDQSPERPSLNLTRLEALIQKGPNGNAPKFWRSLDELADSPEVRKFLDDEFPDRTPDWNEPSKRRTFLKVMGASLGLAGLAACTKQPTEYIVPYVREPEEFVLGKPMFFATAMEMGGYATGLLVESHEGRPTKVEGNPDHPGSLGAADYFNQASVLTLYDPERSQVVTNRGSISSWVNFEAAIAALRPTLNDPNATFRVLTETVISPTIGAQMKQLQTTLPNMKWHQYEPAAKVGSSAGAMLAFGSPVNTIYDFTKADVVVSLDADFVSCGSGNLRYAHDFASKRHILTDAKREYKPKEDRQEGYQPGPAAPYRNQGSTHTEEDTSPPQHPPQVEAQGEPMSQVTQNRLYVVEPAPSPTGGIADHRYALQSGQIVEFARQLAAAVGAGGAGAGGGAAANDQAFKDLPAIGRDLKAHAGSSIVIAGEFQPAEVHALAHAMNAALGNVGKTVMYTDPIEANPVNGMQSIRELVADMNAGKVGALLILGGNPVYNAPADLNFKAALGKVQWKAHVGLYANETAEQCTWHIPGTHYLESWGDTRAYDGTVSIIQPLIEPLYDGRTISEVLAVFTQQPETSPYNIVKAYWASRYTGGDFEAAWETWVHDGLIPNTAAATMAAPPAPKTPPPQNTGGPQGIEVNIRPDLKVWDGHWTNNSWLQELPNPITTITWDNAIWMSPATGKKLGINDQDIVEVTYSGRAVTGAALLVPGHANDSVTVHMGYGRWRSGEVSNDIGINAFLLQSSDAPGGGYGGALRKFGGRHAFASVQHTQTMEEREPIRIATIDEYKKKPDFVNEEEQPIPKWMTLYPDYKYEGYKWGMSIDLNACVGCGACIVACQSENNIPVVGKNEVARGRHMHWIRVDRYFKGNWDNPELYFQPVPCMHCENAPCELVCPVAATVHSGEGLNQMVYNRCVGTRYCSNNCPYKVRRFNFFLYSDWYTQSLFPMRNPDVSVRSRGVMEKCTYCIQRIQAGKITAEKQNRRVMDGEIVPACAQTCPTRAIVFGDINDPKSQIAQLKAQTRTYSLLEELNVRPRTTYMGRLRNPNPEIERPA